MSKSNLEWALEYAKRGMHVFPLFYVRQDGSCSCKFSKCTRIGKHPLVKNGVNMATTDEATIRRWWTESKYANIGMATGHGGVIVMDIDIGTDPKTGAPKVGPESLANLVAANEPLPETRRVLTGGGGTHYYFLTTEEIINSQSKLAKDIDIRGYGGYVILPPSNHYSGGRYEWDGDFKGKIADMPKWLEKLAYRKKVDLSQHTMQPEVLADAEESKKKQLKLTPAQMVKLLDYIPPDCDRDLWWQIGAILKTEMGEKLGYEAWDNWSRKAPDKYDAKIMTVQWNSFEAKGLTAGTLYHHAKEHGFRGFDTESANAPEIRESWALLPVLSVSLRRHD